MRPACVRRPSSSVCAVCIVAKRCVLLWMTVEWQRWDEASLLNPFVDLEPVCNLWFYSDCRLLIFVQTPVGVNCWAIDAQSFEYIPEFVMHNSVKCFLVVHKCHCWGHPSKINTNVIMHISRAAARRVVKFRELLYPKLYASTGWILIQILNVRP